MCGRLVWPYVRHGNSDELTGDDGRTARAMQTLNDELVRYRMETLQAEAAAERLVRRTRRAASPKHGWIPTRWLPFGSRRPAAASRA
jgi:hypothetical protein